MTGSGSTSCWPASRRRLPEAVSFRVESGSRSRGDPGSARTTEAPQEARRAAGRRPIPPGSPWRRRGCPPRSPAGRARNPGRPRCITSASPSRSISPTRRNGPASIIACRCASSRARRSMFPCMAVPCRLARSSGLPRSRSTAEAIVSPFARASASKRSTMRRNSSIAPPSRCRYCCAYSGPWEAVVAPSRPRPKATIRTMRDKHDLLQARRASRTSCSVTSSRAFSTLQALVLRPGSMTRMIVSTPGQPGSLQAISLTAKAVLVGGRQGRSGPGLHPPNGLGIGLGDAEGRPEIGAETGHPGLTTEGRECRPGRPRTRRRDGARPCPRREP